MEMATTAIRSFAEITAAHLVLAARAKAAVGPKLAAACGPSIATSRALS